MNNIDSSFYKAIRSSNYKKIVEIINENDLNLEEYGCFFLNSASEIGDFNIFKLLLNNDKILVEGNNNRVIRTAAEFNHYYIVELLLTNTKIDPTDCNNYAIRYAFEKRNMDIVVLLWNVKSVKNSLKIKNIKLYSEIDSYFIKNKLKQF